MPAMLRFAPIGVFLAVAIGLGFSLRNDPKKMPSTLIDKPVPAFALAPLATGGTGLSSTDFGGQLALINVFASWCPGCQVEHPTLIRLSHDKNVPPLYGINWKDKPGDGARWLKAHRDPYRRVGDDGSGRLGIDMGVTGVPETFVVDRSGRIRYRHAGPITDDVWQEVFEPLLAELRNK